MIINVSSNLLIQPKLKKSIKRNIFSVFFYFDYISEVSNLKIEGWKKKTYAGDANYNAVKLINEFFIKMLHGIFGYL